MVSSNTHFPMVAIGAFMMYVSSGVSSFAPSHTLARTKLSCLYEKTAEKKFSADHEQLSDHHDLWVTKNFDNGPPEWLQQGPVESPARRFAYEWFSTATATETPPSFVLRQDSSTSRNTKGAEWFSHAMKSTTLPVVTSTPRLPIQGRKMDGDWFVDAIHSPFVPSFQTKKSLDGDWFSQAIHSETKTMAPPPAPKFVASSPSDWFAQVRAPEIPKKISTGLKKHGSADWFYDATPAAVAKSNAKANLPEGPNEWFSQVNTPSIPASKIVTNNVVPPGPVEWIANAPTDRPAIHLEPNEWFTAAKPDIVPTSAVVGSSGLVQGIHEPHEWFMEAIER